MTQQMQQNQTNENHFHASYTLFSVCARIKKDKIVVALGDGPIIQNDKKTDWFDKGDIIDDDNEADDVTIDPLIEHSPL